MEPEPDDTRAVLESAWGYIPHTRETTAGLGSFTRLRIERVLALVIGLGSFALGTQAFLNALGEGYQEHPAWHLALMLMTFVPLAAMLVACALGRGYRFFAALFAIVYPLVLILWPFATQGGTPDSVNQPWIWYLVNVATVASILAFRLALQIVWTIGIPLLFGFVRLIQGDFAPEYWLSNGLDVSFALILGGVIATLGWVFRSVATNVDETRARAVELYAVAAAGDAAEQERVAVAALMHDSVLAALIAAERAHTPRERTLAVAMAREALTRLANTEQDSGEGSDEPRDAVSLADDIERAALELGVRVSVERSIATQTHAMPGRIARALVLAATQAIANAAQHAGGAGLAVSVEGRVDPTHVVITVRDTGEGFDLDRVADDRLGIRASIFARVAAVGGTTAIESDSQGTTVRLEWMESVS